MSASKYLPHVFVLPEDDANRQLANGFHLDVFSIRQLQVLEVAGGWAKLLDRFQSVHVREMEKCPNRFMVLLIDFDGRKDRLDQANAFIPNHLTDRVFVLGVWTEPEDLDKAALGNYEIIGRALARDCREETDTTWGHALLRHNATELGRLRERVRPILFQPI
jgi:hypothetical protein